MVVAAVAAAAAGAPACLLVEVVLGTAAVLDFGVAPVPWLSSAAIKLTSLSALGAVAVLAGLLPGVAAGLPEPASATTLAGGALEATAGWLGVLAGTEDASAFSRAAGGGFTPSSSAVVILLSGLVTAPALVVALVAALTAAGFTGDGSLIICAAASGATAATVALVSMGALGSFATAEGDLKASSAFSSMMTLAFKFGLLGCWLASMY